MNFQELENALRAAVKTASALDDGHVIWNAQNGNRPSDPFIDLKRGPLVPLGAAEERTDDYDPARPTGQEIALNVGGPREVSLTLQAFTASTTDTTSAEALLTKVQTRLSLDSIRDTLADAGISLFDRGSVQSVPGILNTAFEGRAVLVMRFYVEYVESEFTTYIETVDDPDPTYVP